MKPCPPDPWGLAWDRLCNCGLSLRCYLYCTDASVMVVLVTGRQQKHRRAHRELGKAAVSI
ncbi:hypothetical protein HaLaN_00018 [Haematococcus lacustris]|uniref:Uncharacterized protein n=1 Tax=Haematococcus lacustris TaxID=44745 RepID=A0A699YCG6_HAELA|nr:hypothetical protein HaLaN_00018 [Haematococcus lacustris]